MTLMALLIRLRATRVSLIPHDGRLRVEAPAGTLTDDVKKALTQHKEELLHLPRPYLRPDGTLIDPIYAPPQYFWQPLSVTLSELNAPPEVWRQYTSVPYPADDANTDIGVISPTATSGKDDQGDR